ncbi:MAG: hypothetical protein R3F37_17265 [Candidatus Competibacteraceae bacterium]
MRRIEEIRARASRFCHEAKAFGFRVTGKYRKILQENEQQALETTKRDRREWQQFIQRQQRERRTLQHEFRQLRHHHSIIQQKLHRDIGVYLEMSQAEQEKALSQSVKRETRPRRRRQSRDFE